LRDPQNVVQREQYYLDLLKPEYNVLSKAGYSFGYKHSEETLAKLRARKKTEGTGRPSKKIEVFDNE
jgi:hypothetical protein